jgi:paraquat-inducible protein B
MSLDRNTAVGAFVLGGIVLAVAAAVMFGNFNLFRPSIRAAVVFQGSIGGLSVGSPVTFRGVPIGAVESISIEYNPSTNTAYIPVIVRLDAGRTLITPVGPEDATFDVALLVKRGLRAELQVQSFVTGQSQIDLDFAPSTSADVHPGVSALPEIPARQSAFQRARDQLSQLPLHDLADNAVATLQSLKALTNKLNQDLPPLVDTLKATSDKSSQTLDTVSQAVQSLQQRLDTTLQAITTVATTGNDQLQQRGGDLHTLLVNASQATTQVRDLLTQLQGVTSSRASTRTNIEATARDLAAAAASLRGFAGDIERNPQLLLTGRRQ